MSPLRILMVASEAAPWIKTGGLADAVGSLARALAALGHDVRLLLPAYHSILRTNSDLQRLGDAPLLMSPAADGLQLLLLDRPEFTAREGNPYHDGTGRDWPDNWQRYGQFAAWAGALAGDRLGYGWQPDIVHCHDWQAGLVPVQMLLNRVPAASVFTIHNLGYRGLFPAHALGALQLPGWLWHADALEFHDSLCFMKGGLVFADRLNTVSPTYAEEILQPAHGHGLDGLLRHRRGVLSGILNGIDQVLWDPSRDPALAAAYGSDDLAGKARCKADLRRRLGLRGKPAAPLLGLISRLVPQKGIDLVLDILPALLERGCQLAILGSGDPAQEQALREAARAHPGQIGLQLGFDEDLAHRIEAGADLFLMPSRFEPCGLNQMYSQRYGTPPVVHRTGGLADSVIDAAEADRGSGFVFAPATAEALLTAVDRALALRRKPELWQALQRRGMQRDFSWSASAQAYLALYRDALAQRRRVWPSSGLDTQS